MKDALEHGSDSRGAADALSQNHPKSVGVPVHPAFVMRISASENPKSPNKDRQDYQEKIVRYGGTNSKAAVNWAIKKAHATWPDHRRHAADMVD